jgi:A/G-specific adenine glycosylase
VTGREWLRELLADLADDGLVDITDDRESTVVRLQQ